MANENQKQTPIETAAIAAVPVITTATALEALNAYGQIDANWIQDIPGADHLSSMAGSLSIGVIGSIATERIANRVAQRSTPAAAEKIRRLGNVVTFLGSVACQVAIETSTKGTGDPWDVVAGVAATIPGIVAGKGYAKLWKQPSPKR